MKSVSLPAPPRSLQVVRSILLVSVMLASGAFAQTPCGSPSMQNLVEPPEISAQNGVLSTSFVVQEVVNPCVPFFDGTNWTMKTMKLRTYGFPTQAGADLTLSTPGPTLRVRRADGNQAGDKLEILLVNKMSVPTVPDNQCDSACPPNDRTCCPPPGEPCPSSCTSGCAQPVFPECFHGDNTTNLHFHGSHISPQSPQDYVLLALQPEGTPSKFAGHAHSRGTAGSGQFQYAVNPFPAKQAEGTHWYHPHKHGSVSIQVLNGMAGALIVEGPFDDWLNGYYQNQGGLDEKVLVLQQLDKTVNFFNKNPTYSAPIPLINGQANPVLTMAPGEIQRWRFVSATMQGSAQLALTFEGAGAPIVKQIAQDGAQFAPANYSRQPLLTNGLSKFTLSPGNRADFLVQAPTTPGLHQLSFEVTDQLPGKILERHEADVRGLLKLQAAEAARNNLVAAAKPPLLTIKVEGTPREMTMPTSQEWPQMPSFLADIATSEVRGERSLLFSMTGTPGNQPNSFFINNKQFDPSCVDETMTIGTAEQWSVTNSTSQQHPYHIHTNPYQVTAIDGQAQTAPWVWYDTYPLPVQSKTPVDHNAGPISSNQAAQTICPATCGRIPATWNGEWKTTVPGHMSVCGCLAWGAITTRSRFEDFTGEFVIHCHFLGHEDRGMMIGVQTVCPNTTKPLWGTAAPSGTADNCATNLPASPQCTQ